ncbi:MAG: TetR/AcrR family transcriptional regulator [Thermoanaerobaculia bacterium]|nr:TetR/AcrR family transcriptional regulator [Thermoanaerobaculia bacterium]MBP9824976.1 TetR/AcrR family transcriptional regulator [Thermoanaerobaculia bacterium]
MDNPLDGATTRQKIRQAALELFGERGYDGAAMTALAERVGIAKPSLYNYYRSKEELLLDLVRDGISQWREACMAPFGRPDTFERQLGDHLRLAVEFARDRPHLIAIFHLATTHVPPELGQRIHEVVSEVEGAIRATILDRIDAARAAGEIDTDAADAQIFLGIFFHGLLFLQAGHHHSAAPVESRLPQIWRLLFRALSGREPQEDLS